MKSLYLPSSNLVRHKHKGYKLNGEHRKYGRWFTTRYVYGVGRLDLWSYGPSNAMSLLYQIFSRMDSELASALCLQIAVVDNIESEDESAEPLDPVDAMRIHEDTLDSIGKLFEAIQPEMFYADVPENVFIHDYAALESFTPEDDVKWLEWRGVFEDPTKRYIEQLTSGMSKSERKRVIAKHKHGRINFGSSVYDLEYAPFSYFIWQYVNVAIFCLSKESHLMRPYAKDLLKCVKGLYVLGFGKNATLTSEQEEFRDYAVRNFAEFIRNLWD